MYIRKSARACHGLAILAKHAYHFRERLRDNWGIVDVDDVANAANHLAKEGKVDGKRLCIDGGSAGGTLVTLFLSLYDRS